MNKIIIDPHYSSREEYEELKEYLSEHHWDWKEVKPIDHIHQQAIDDIQQLKQNNLEG